MKGDSIPSLCGGMFSTSKGDSQSQTIGKYGVGLKAILLFYHSTLTVSSSTRDEDCVTSYRLCIDPVGDSSSPLTVLKRKAVPKPEQLRSSLSGTQITIDNIKGDDSLLYHQVEEYFHRFIAMFPPFHLQIHITSHSSLEYVSTLDNISFSIHPDCVQIDHFHLMKSAYLLHENTHHCSTKSRSTLIVSHSFFLHRLQLLQKCDFKTIMLCSSSCDM